MRTSHEWIVLAIFISNLLFPGTPGHVVPPPPAPPKQAPLHGTPIEEKTWINKPDGTMVRWSEEEDAKIPPCSENLAFHTTCKPTPEQQAQERSLVVQRSSDYYSDTDYWTMHFKLTVDLTVACLQGGNKTFSEANGFDTATRILRWHGIEPKMGGKGPIPTEK